MSCFFHRRRCVIPTQDSRADRLGLDELARGLLIILIIVMIIVMIIVIIIVVVIIILIVVVIIGLLDGPLLGRLRLLGLETPPAHIYIYIYIYV